MKKLIALLLALMLCFSLLASCGETGGDADATPTPSATPTEDADGTEDSNETPEFATFTDSAGRIVELPSELTAISPSGALAQMFLIAIAPDLMVSVASSYSDEQAKYVPNYVMELPVVGQFYGSADLNFESIASIAPQLVIDVGEPKDTVVEDMDSITTNLAIPAVHITATLDSTPEAFRTLGKLLNREQRGEELAQFCEKILAQTDNIMTQVGENKVRGLYLTGETGQNVIAATSYHAEVIDYIIDNIAIVDSPSSRGTGNETDLEQITVWNPEVIIFSPDGAYEVVSNDPAWQAVDAIKSGSYYETPIGPYNWFGSPPSVNRYLCLIWLTKLLYPEYADYDFYEQVNEYYNLFYGYDLSEADFNALTTNSLA